MSGALKFAGLEVQLGGRTFVMPPLSAKGAKTFWPRMLALQAGNEPDVLDLGAGVAHACLVRNYPELTRDEVDDLVDLGNVEELLAKAGGNGSFQRWTRQQLELQAAEGNAPTHPPQPAATDGTGAASTPASPPPPGGASPTSTS